MVKVSNFCFVKLSQNFPYRLQLFLIKRVINVQELFNTLCEYFRTFLSNENETFLSNGHEIFLVMIIENF